MARILFLTQVLPYPLDSGAKIRAYYVLRHLTRQHQVTLVSFVRADDRAEDIGHLQGFCRAVHPVPMQRSRLRDTRAVLVAGFTDQPVIIVRDELGAMRALLRRLVREETFDLIHADQTSMAQYALYARSHAVEAGGRPRIILDAHNALYRIPERLAAHEHNLLKRLLLQREARALARYEAALWGRFDHVVFVAEQDRQTLLARLSNGRPPLPYTTIPICVDPAVQPLIERALSPCTITHLGTMFWPPNVEGVMWFGQEVFPQVLAQVPGARFVIVGKNPPPEVYRLPAQISHVEVTGYVADPAPYLAETAVFIVPLRAGGGMRVKIPDAWCRGTPIVSTTIGAEGIELQDGVHALIADTPEALAAAVVRVLQNPALGEQLRQNGRQWVEEHYNWRKVYSRWDEVYSTLLVG